MTPNVKADATQCFHGPHNSPGIAPKSVASRALKKANLGPENGFPGWEVPNRDKLQTSSCNSSKQQGPLLHPSWDGHIQESLSSVPHSQGWSSPMLCLSFLQSGWELPAPPGQQKSNGIYPGRGQRAVGLTARSCLSLAPSSPQITTSECLLSPPLDSIWHLPPLTVERG